MGPDDRWLEQQEEHGHSLDLAKNFLEVCPGCIADDGLRRFVANHAPIQRCDFCGGPGPQGLSLGVLFDYMGDRIATEWDRAVEVLFLGEGDETWEAGGAAVYDASELLGELDEPLSNEKLREEFVGAFDNDWVSRHAFRQAHHQVLTESWLAFARYVKQECRYLFLRTGQGKQADEEEIPPARILDEVAMAIENGGLISQLPAGTRLVRARQHGLEEVLATPAQLGSPPRDRTAANRMSPPGISMFYGSEDANTALAELRPQAFPRLATVATWITARSLRYLDLVDVDVPSLFDLVAGTTLRPWLLFLHDFAAQVSLPPGDDGAAVDYVPTQVLTEYVHRVLGDPDDPVRGIRYPSAARTGGVSWVLFVDAAGCTDAAPGWEGDPGHWLGLDWTSLQRFRCWSWVEAE